MNQAKIISQSPLVIEEVNDPEAIAASLEAFEYHRRNSEWLQAHWPDVLPQARGQFVAVAGQEAFITGTAEEAWEWAQRAHPKDKGPLVQYVRKDVGPRIYAYQR